MNVNKLLRLCSRCIFHSKYKYSNANILNLRERGMYEDLFPDTSTNEIEYLLKRSKQCIYAGFDPTADSLHVGNLLVIMNLLHWQRAGHQVIALLGGATGLIGDPSYRKKERAEIQESVLEDNLEHIRNNIETVFANHEKHFWSHKKKALKPLLVVNNLDWYKNVNIIEFIREIGKYFRLGRMLSRSSVQSRLQSEEGMSFTEFTYQIFQAYDWYQLAKHYNCHFQVGGNDQMGNIISGYDLVTKTTDKKVYGLTLPLITAEGGKKFGKSTGNAVWLSPSKSSSFQLYQFFMRTKDSDIEKFLKFFTFLPISQIIEIVVEHNGKPENRIGQKVLAKQITLLVHGEDGLRTAMSTSAALYDKSIDSLTKLSASELIDAFEGATIVDICANPGVTIYEVAMQANCFRNEQDAQRIISAGGFYVNHQKITNLQEVVVPGIHILSNNISLLRVGKKTYHVVRWM